MFDYQTMTLCKNIEDKDLKFLVICNLLLTSFLAKVINQALHESTGIESTAEHLTQKEQEANTPSKLWSQSPAYHVWWHVKGKVGQ